MAEVPFRHQWPGNQRALRAKRKPPSPHGYTGRLVEMYYTPSNSFKVTFENPITEYRYSYEVPLELVDHALFWNLKDYYYLIINIDDHGYESIKECKEACARYPFDYKDTILF